MSACAKLLPALALITASPLAFAATDPYALSPQDVLNGASSIEAAANYGKGVVFADIDTGIVPQWIGFSSTYNGQGVSNFDSKDSASCLTSTCRAGTPTDGNGHGTFTASEIVGGVKNSGFEGMAPGGSLLAVQVLNAQGSGTSTAVANGITYAASHGAQVMNLSLGPGGTAAQNQAFYQSLASSINYAASKNVYVVFAGGNSAQALAGGLNITGLTDTAIQHLLFMGSTNASKQLSTFSNTPGAGGFVSTTGKFYAYDSMWLMADGENIWGASINHTFQNGYSYIQQDSGTSMAAPQGTGAIGLLIAAWPVLKTNGKAAQILEQTGSDLGAAGIDTVYGSGYLNLVQAFQPLGTTTVTTAGGKSVPVSSLSTNVISSGALGKMSNLSSALSHYTIFDAYQRNFTVDLSGMVVGKPSLSSVAQSVGAPKPVLSATHFADGSSLAFGNADPVASVDHPASNSASTQNWFASFTDAGGATMAAGYGFPASASFADALWGNDSPIADASATLGVNDALMSLAEGGAFAAFGTPLNSDTRMALSWAQTQPSDGIAGTNWMQPTASALSAGISGTLVSGWKGGVTLGMLDEQSGLLGTTYGNSGLLSLGNKHQSMSVDVSSAIALGDKSEMLLDASIARADGANLSGGLISSITPLYARSFGGALVQRDALDAGDAVSLSLRAPLRVYSGSAALAMTSVDDNGTAVTTSQHISMRPSGNEMDFTVGYQAPVKDSMSWNASVEARRDADNIAGVNDVAALVGARWAF